MARKLPSKDVVIIGLGWTGSILGYELAKAGLDVVAIERGVQHDVRQDVDGQRQVLVQHLDVVAGVFLRRERIELAADRVDRLRDILGRPRPGALEEHVLDKVGDAVQLRLFVPRSGLDPNADRDGADVLHLLGQHNQTVGQHLAPDVAEFFHHDDSLCPVLSSRASAGSPTP